MSDERKKSKNSHVHARQEERRERDTSPSALSQSSASAVLEWDPSADVGTRRNQDTESADEMSNRHRETTPSLSTLERMALTLTSGLAQRSSRPSKTSAFTRSHSEEDAKTSDVESTPQSHRSTSLIDLAVVKSLADPKQILKIKGQDKKDNDDSPTSSLATVKSTGSRNSRKEKKNVPLFLASTSGSSTYTKRERNPDTPPSSAGATASSHSRPSVSSGNNEEASSNDDENIVTGGTEIRKATRGGSEVSTDWEYGPSLSRSPSRDQDTNTLLEWQSGLTRSEITYQKRHRDDSGSTGTFSINVELSGNPNEPNQGGLPQRQRKPSKRNLGEDSVGYDTTDMSPETSSYTDISQTQVFSRTQSNTTVKDPRPSKIESFKQPRGSRSSSDSTTGISRHKSTQVPSVSVTSTDAIAATTSADETCSNLSSNCELLLNMAKFSPGIPDSDVLSALTVHRFTHIKRVRKELHRLNALNRVIENASRNRIQSENASSSSSDGSGPIKSSKNGHSSRSDSKQYTSTPLHHAKLPEPQQRSEGQAKKSKQTQYSVPSSAVSSSTKLSNDRQDSFNFLMDKMNILTDICILNQKIPTPSESTSSSCSEIKAPKTKTSKKSHAHTESTKKSHAESAKKSVGSKRAVSFFIPFPGCKWEQNGVLTGEDLHQVGSGTTLREVYERVRPETVSKMHHREVILAQMKQERELRAEIKREWIKTHHPEEISGLADVLPPKGERVMSTREMKELTRSKYKRLAEVKEKILQRARNDEKMTNRLMSQHFAHNLKKKVLRGEKNIEHSRSIIRD